MKRNEYVAGRMNGKEITLEEFSDYYDDALSVAKRLAENGTDEHIFVSTMRDVDRTLEEQVELVRLWDSKDDKNIRERYLEDAPEYWSRAKTLDNLPTSDKPSIYFDIDGTLGKWYADGRGYSSLEEIIDPANHYFRDIEPHSAMVLLAEELQNQGYDVCVISAADRNTIRDKAEWIENNMPFLPKENIFFSPLGADKTEFVKGNAEFSLLIDDYNKNLDEWKGTAIKAINTVNSHQDKYPEIDFTAIEQRVEERLEHAQELLDLGSILDYQYDKIKTNAAYEMASTIKRAAEYVADVVKDIEGQLETERTIVMENGEKTKTNEEEFMYDYQMLGRLQSDVKYYIDSPEHRESALWAKNVEEQVTKMQELYDKFPEGLKPEWCTENDIKQYAQDMANVKYANSELMSEILNSEFVPELCNDEPYIETRTDNAFLEDRNGELHLNVQVPLTDEGYKELYARGNFEMKEKEGLSFDEILEETDMFFNAYADIYADGKVGFTVLLDDESADIVLSEKEQADLYKRVEQEIGNIEHFLVEFGVENDVQALGADSPLDVKVGKEDGINLQVSFYDEALDEVFKRAGVYEKLSLDSFDDYINSSYQLVTEVEMRTNDSFEDLKLYIHGDDLPRTQVPLSREEKEDVFEKVEECLEQEGFKSVTDFVHSEAENTKELDGDRREFPSNSVEGLTFASYEDGSGGAFLNGKDVASYDANTAEFKFEPEVGGDGSWEHVPAKELNLSSQDFVQLFKDTVEEKAVASGAKEIEKPAPETDKGKNTKKQEGRD